MSLISRVLWGAAAGAAGTTALNAVTYGDMVARARPASEMPAETAKELASIANVDLGDEESTETRGSALGALMGIGAGVGIGAAYGLFAPALRKTGFGQQAVIAGTAAFVAGEGAPVALGKTNPLSWGPQGWLSGLIPHAIYGAVVAAVMRSRS